MVALQASRVLAASLALVVPLLAGCAQVGVSNQTNHFSYGGQVAGKSGTDEYVWKVTGTKANVQWGGQSAQGSFQLTIKDSSGKQVFSKSVSGTQQGGFQETTQAGVAGDWKVILTFNGFTGQMGLSLDVSATSGGYCPPGVPGC